MSYAQDVAKLRYGRINDGTMRFATLRGGRSCATSRTGCKDF